MAPSGDEFRMVTSGEVWKPTADEVSAFRRAALANDAKINLGAVPEDVSESIFALCVRVKNSTGGSLPRWSVVELGEPLVGPDDNLAQFLRKPNFDGTVPTALTVIFGVLLEPLRDGAIGKVAIGGAVPVRLEVAPTDLKEYATVKDGDSSVLLNADVGTARVLWVEPGAVATERWALVRLGDSAGVGTGVGSVTLQEVDSGLSVISSLVGGTHSFSNEYGFELVSGLWRMKLASETQIGVVDVDTPGGGIQWFGGDKGVNGSWNLLDDNRLTWANKTGPFYVIASFFGFTDPGAPSIPDPHKGKLTLRLFTFDGTSDGVLTNFNFTENGLDQDGAVIGASGNYEPGGSDPIDWAGSIIRAGSTAGRPASAAANAGTLYADTEAGVLYRDNGTTWDEVANTAGANAQPEDDTLTALAGLAITANSMILGTGADAFTVLGVGANQFLARSSTGDVEAKSVTDFGLTVLDDADAATARATLGASEIGHDHDGDYVSLSSQSANVVLAGPSSGPAANPTFRALVASDIPGLDASKITSGAFSIPGGGTGFGSIALGEIPYGPPSGSTMSKIAANTSSTRQVLTMASSSPLWKDWITDETSTAKLGSAYAITSSWSTVTGCTLSLTKGKWLISFVGRAEYQFSAGSFGGIAFRVHDGSAGVDPVVALNLGRATGTYYQDSGSGSAIVTLSGSATVALQVIRHTATTWTTSNVIGSGGVGDSYIQAVKIGEG